MQSQGKSGKTGYYVSRQLSATPRKLSTNREPGANHASAEIMQSTAERCWNAGSAACTSPASNRPCNNTRKRVFEPALALGQSARRRARSQLKAQRSPTPVELGAARVTTSSEAERAASAARATLARACARRRGRSRTLHPDRDDAIRSAPCSLRHHATVVVRYDPEHPASNSRSPQPRIAVTAPRPGWAGSPRRWNRGGRAGTLAGPAPHRADRGTRRSRAARPITCSERRASLDALVCSSRRVAERPPPVEHALPPGAREAVVEKHPELPERGDRTLELG
jgi:hypothetical protein